MKISDSKHRLIELLNITEDTQNDMANKTKIPKSSISHYINGEREPRQDKIMMIAEAYRVSPGWIMGLDVPMEFEIEKQKDISNWNPKALELYSLYENATPEARELVENFLKSSQQKK